MDVLLTLSGYIFSAVTSVVSWMAGTRSRRNSVYQEMLETVKTLTTQNSELQETVVRLQNEVIEVRRENAELKAGQQAMTRQLSELQNENAELRAIVVRGNKIPAPKKQLKS